jgi:pyruvate/2-oxoglutarate dehydrogenase complex dihydrolipoamide acyltransferase (E2) component
MTYEIRLPALAGVDNQAPIRADYLAVSKGEAIAQGDSIAKVSCDREEFWICTNYTGRIRKLPLKRGAELKVGDVIATLDLRHDRTSDLPLVFAKRWNLNAPVNPTDAKPPFPELEITEELSTGDAPETRRWPIGKTPLLRSLAIWFRGPSILRQAETDFRAAWPNIAWIFSNARQVSIGPTGGGGIRILEVKILRAARLEPAPAEAVFLEHITSDDPMIAAYCISGLQVLHSPFVPEAAAKLKSRKERLLYCPVGCLGAWFTLGRIARIAEHNHAEYLYYATPSPERKAEPNGLTNQ